MLSTNDIVTWVNKKIQPFIEGLKTYGIAKAAAKGDSFMPYTGEHYIGIDDTYQAQAYHKQLSIASANVPRSGFGDNDQDLQNTYGMALVLFFDEKKQGMDAGNLYTFIQSSITGRLKSEGYKSIRVSVSSINLNDPQVWAQEYGSTPYRLSGTQRLVQINYTIIMVFDKNCITIPNCKN